MSIGDDTRDQGAADPILRVDELCDQFDDEWRAGNGRSAKEYLRALGRDLATAPPELLDGLARLEAEHRGMRKQISNSVRFAPGTLIGGRYRVEGLLGKGGMGEVYRAHDQRLGQSVALKFLPAHLAIDPIRREQFKNEVLVARQVTHQNVCRVHDYDELDGQPFLSMEYIDGEDLASLLKRIRRLPEDTATELARQLCLGLAAAHEQGLLHRDLKPQNIMIDGRGQARITDFGLAGRAGSFSGLAVRAGTPLYQAPEQLAGTEVTNHSDIYSLGLVLYEMFTGQRAYHAATVAELIRLHRDGTPATPSSHIPHLNPAVERAILKCLEPVPANRPRSVIEVLRELPGGKLDEAIFKGATPSPHDVSEAGPEGRLPPRLGMALFGLALSGVLFAAWWNDHGALFRQTPQDLSPRELTVRARSHLKQMGYEAPMADSANGVATDESLLKHLRANNPDQLKKGGLKSGQPAVMYFWYRQSSQPLAQRLAANDTSGWSMPGRVLPNEPPMREAGMTCVFLDLEGRLLEFHAVPKRQSPETTIAEPNPKTLLALAGFTDNSLRESNEFQHLPPVFADRRMAWEGHHPSAPKIKVHVEAAFYRGLPVYFHVGRSGSGDRLPGFIPENTQEHWQEVKNMLLGLIALPFGGWFAWRNWKLHRAHPRGASILAGTFVALGLVGWLLAAKHVPVAADELSMFCAMLGRVLFDGLLLWMAYLALEPWVRRTSPWRVISWNRLLEGKWRNALVGRDVLIGVTGGAGFVALVVLLRAVPGWFGDAPSPRLVWDLAFTDGLGSLLLTKHIAVLVALRYFFMYFLLLLVCRREWVAAGFAIVIWVVPYAHGGDHHAARIVIGLLFALANLLVLRVGLLAFVAFTLTEEVLIYMPVTIDFSAWYIGVSTLSLLLVISLAAYGFWVTCRHRFFLPVASQN